MNKALHTESVVDEVAGREPNDVSLEALDKHYAFVSRHLGSDDKTLKQMLGWLDIESLESLLEKAVPESILQKGNKAIAPLDERAVLEYLRHLIDKNDNYRSFIGMGYYGTIMPAVILRNMFENPGWYTAYTPYQAEIAQGRLEMLMNFQQLTLDLTGLDVASASLLDEATAAAEAMTLSRRVSKNRQSDVFYVDECCHPQTIDVIKTRAQGVKVRVITGPASLASEHNPFGVLLAYPGTYGNIEDYRDLITALHENKTIVSMVSDIMSLVLLESPGNLGADIALGSAQRFGVPVGFGGPHAAFFATRDQYKRNMPGRIIGLSVDSRGKSAYRMALQTREQHIRRDKATSNICTSQVLLANVAAAYAIYHGAAGVDAIARRIHRLANILAKGLASRGMTPENLTWFDTLTFKCESNQTILNRADKVRINLRVIDSQRVSVAIDEATTKAEIVQLWDIFLGEGHGLDLERVEHGFSETCAIPRELRRTSKILKHEVFNRYHSETAMMRYLKMLEDRDLALNRSMIALGSCTMKLNAVTEMLPVSWPEIANLHPFAPQEQVRGMIEVISELEEMLREITGFAAISMQPNSGAQGEYSGLLAICRFHASRGERHRNVCLIPASAHGTNPASAIMCGMKVVVVDCDKRGNVNTDELEKLANKHADNLAAFMITYPSTHGVYEEGIAEMCEVIHKHGGQVYMDGANLNALVGVSRPADFGVDVMHFNLHKTFCIPHGGGGPGMGPIGVAKHLEPFLPGHGSNDNVSLDHHAVSAAPWGSASILPISWCYMKMMGSEGLRKATAVAILNANYLARKLESYYPILYRGKNGKCAHEFIIDLRPLKNSAGITDEDVAKRLIDYGFHSPTMSFPVSGTLMIEPTESESREELDRFANAMIAIRKEIGEIESGIIALEESPVYNAPHTADDILEHWSRAYSRETAIFPEKWVKLHKFWPSVNRIDNVHGDRYLMCSCPPMSDYETE